jgi:hypothetical protein
MAEDSRTTRLRNGEAWRDFCDRLKDAGDKILEAAPDDDFDRAEGLRYLSRLTHHFLRSTIDESDPAMALLASSSPKIGLDNPDYVYTGGRLSSKYEYLLSIELNDAHMLGIGSFSGALGTSKGLVRDGYVTTEALEIDRDSEGNRSVEIMISQRPHHRNWLPMLDGTNTLNIRQTLLRRREQVPARFMLERIDGGEKPAPLEPESLVSALDRVGLMVEGIIDQFIVWTSEFKARPFEIHPIDPKFLAVAQGDPNTTYHYSYWELEDDEIFEIILEPPTSFDYWNLQIGNHWLESLDYLHRQTHVNHETAVVEEDGRVRILVCAEDPEHPNWLDTAGHRRGALALRWVGANETPAQPRTSVVKHGSRALLS